MPAAIHNLSLIFQRALEKQAAAALLCVMAKEHKCHGSEKRTFPCFFPQSKVRSFHIQVFLVPWSAVISTVKTLGLQTFFPGKACEMHTWGAKRAWILLENWSFGDLDWVKFTGWCLLNCLCGRNEESLQEQNLLRKGVSKGGLWWGQRLWFTVNVTHLVPTPVNTYTWALHGSRVLAQAPAHFTHHPFCPLYTNFGLFLSHPAAQKSIAKSKSQWELILDISFRCFLCCYQKCKY